MKIDSAVVIISEKRVQWSLALLTPLSSNLSSISTVMSASSPEAPGRSEVLVIRWATKLVEERQKRDERRNRNERVDIVSDL